MPVHREPRADPIQLHEACRRTNPEVEVQISATLGEALERTQAAPFVVVASPLYLIGEAMESLHLTATPNGDEKPLNNRTANAVEL